MRAMFSCLPSVGHLHAIVPLARAVQETGHDVVVVTSPAFTATVEETGLRAVGAGLDWLESEVERGFPDLVRDVSDVYTNRHFWPMAFVRAARTLLPEMLRLLTSLRPDVVLSEGLDYAAPLAAEAIGIPHARWSIEAYRPQRLVAGTLGPVWNQTRIELGLLPDPQLDRLCPSLYLDLYPPCLQRVPPQELPPVCRSLRPEPFLPGGDEAPDRLAPQEERPTVLVTLGTIFNRAEGALELLVEALAGEPVNVVAAIGANRDPASLGPQPDNVRVERYVSLPAVLDRADLVVCHAPYNTTVAALQHGVPVLALPFRADQLHNAWALSTSGAGLWLDRRTATAADVRQAARRILADSLYRRNAERLAADIRALPPLRTGVELLERLAGGEPVRAGDRRAPAVTAGSAG